MSMLNFYIFSKWRIIRKMLDSIATLLLTHLRHINRGFSPKWVKLRTMHVVHTTELYMSFTVHFITYTWKWTSVFQYYVFLRRTYQWKYRSWNTWGVIQMKSMCQECLTNSANVVKALKLYNWVRLVHFDHRLHLPIKYSCEWGN